MELDLDKLKAVRVLGRGAMGTVFLVTPRRPPDHLVLAEDDHNLPPLFALKVFDKRSAAAKRPDADRRARWELNVLSRLSAASGRSPHPFLPSLIGSVETSELLAWAVVMDITAVPFCPGGDLHHLRHSLSPDAAFSPAAIRFYLSELVSALAHLHSLRIAYRDLKPENILLQSSGHITLTDFDLSRYLPPKTSASVYSPPPLIRSMLPPPPSADANHGHHRHRHRRHLTRIFAFGGGAGTTSRTPVESQQHHSHHFLQLKKTRSARVSPVSRRKPSFSSCDAGDSSDGGCERSFSFVGTEEYVSPEVVRGEGHEFAVDWWALGILTYEMAYGRTPFGGRNRKETFRNVLTRAPEFLGRRRTDLTDLIERLLAKDPTRRLGYAGGAEEVKAHPFFHGVRWDLLAEVTRPPFLAPLEDLEEEVMGPGGYGSAEGFDIRDYLNGLQRPQASLSTLPSSESLGEF